MSVSYLDGENQYMDSAKKKYDAKISIQFTKLPPILFIQLKRFDYNYVTGSMTKLNTRIEYPEKLDLCHYLNEKDSTFSLYGVIVHKGDKSFGHYYCYIKSKDKVWRKFNDNRVSRVSMSEVLDANFGGSKQDFKVSSKNEIYIDEEEKNESAYILFYIKDSCYDKVFIDFDKENIPVEVKKFLEMRKGRNDASPSSLEMLSEKIGKIKKLILI